MKKIFVLITLIAVAFSCGKVIPQKQKAVNPTVAVVWYTSDDPVQVAAAAIVGIKYPFTTYYDIDGKTSSQITALVNAMDSVDRAFVLVDSATVWADNKLSGTHFKNIDSMLYKTVDTLATQDTINQYVRTSSTQTRCEVVWTSLYPTYTEPLIVEFLGYNQFSRKHSMTKHTNAAGTLVDTTGSMTTNAYATDYVIVTSGTGFGQYRLVNSNNATTFTLATNWTVIPDRSSYVVKKAAELNEFLYDQYAALYVTAFLADLSDANVIAAWHKLIDKEYNINDGNVLNTPHQDYTYLKNTVIAGGKAIFDYLYKVAN